jgi:hypothetical protein
MPVLARPSFPTLLGIPSPVLAAGTGAQALPSPAMPTYSTDVLMAQRVPGTWWTFTEEVPVRPSSRLSAECRCARHTTQGVPAVAWNALPMGERMIAHRRRSAHRIYLAHYGYFS